MKKLTALLLFACLVIGLTGCSGNSPSDNTPSGNTHSYYGTWSIDSLLPNSPLGDFREDDLDIILNTELTYSAEEATCFGDQIDSLGQTVTNPEYITSDMPKNTFESMLDIYFEDLGIKGDSITQVAVVNDPSYNDGIVFYVVNDDTLVSNSLGTFFLLKRVN